MGDGVLNIRRLLMTTDTAGGVWDYSVELSRALKDFNVEVLLASMGNSPDKGQLKSVSSLDNVTHVHKDYKLEWMPSPWDDIEKAGEWLLELEKDYNPDVVHLNQYCFGDNNWNSPTLIVAHSDVISWHEAVYKSIPNGNWSRYFEAVSAGLRKANAVTAPTLAMLRALKRHYGEFKDVYPIYNSRNKNNYKSSEKENFILNAGRLWDVGKNAAKLDQAASNIIWDVYLAGETVDTSGNEFKPDNAKVLGKLPHEELADYMSRAGIYALPAKYEPFGLSALEAAFSGCPLVLGDIASLREIWKDNALYVNPDDENDIANKINELAENSSLRKYYSAKAFNRAKNFSNYRMVYNYISLYNNLMQEANTKQKQYTVI